MENLNECSYFTESDSLESLNEFFPIDLLRVGVICLGGRGRLGEGEKGDWEIARWE